MAKLQYLVIHCTATPEGKSVSSADIRRWHTSQKSNCTTVMYTLHCSSAADAVRVLIGLV